MQTRNGISNNPIPDPPAESAAGSLSRWRALWAWPTGMQLLISGLIAGLGLLGATALGVVDQDLRSMYTEYTLAATNLAHSSSDLLRYRITITRAVEAATKKDFDRIAASLPAQRARILTAVGRYAEAGRAVLKRGSRGDQDLQGFQRSLHAYFASADETRALLAQLWHSSPTEAATLRRQAELHAAEDAGPKLVEASEALERLLFGVAEVGKDMRDQGTNSIRLTSLVLVLGSLLIAGLNLIRS
jgi:hypothetical protein